MAADVHVMHVEVLSVDIGCDRCGSSLTDVPKSIAIEWAMAHRDPAVLATDLVINGSPSRWVRRRRTA